MIPRQVPGLVPALVATTLLWLVGCTDAGGDEPPGAPAASAGDVTGAEDASTADVTGGVDVAGSEASSDPGEGDVTQDGEGVAPPQGQWSTESLGDGGWIESAYAVNAVEAYAVGGERVLRYNGRVWVSYGDIPGATLHGVYSDGVETVVVGDDGLVARRGVDDVSWTREDPGTDKHLWAVSGVSSGDLWAVGGGSSILRYIDGAWTVASSGGSVSLRSVWVPEDGDVDGVMASGSGGLIYKRVGGQWVTEQVAGGETILHGIWGAGESRFVVGTAVNDQITLSGKEDASSPWDGHNANVNKPVDMEALGSALGDVYAVGRNGTLLKYTGGKTWSVISLEGLLQAASPLTAMAYAPAGAGQGVLWLALGETGGGIRQVNGVWQDMETRPSGGLRAVAGPARSALVFAGDDGILMVPGVGPDGEGQGYTALPTGTDEDLLSVAVAKDGTIWAGGTQGTLLRRPEDAAVEVVAIAAPGDLLSVATDDEEVVVASRGGLLFRSGHEEPQFTPWVVGAPGDVNVVKSDGEGGWWLGGSLGYLAHVPSGSDTPEIISIPTGGAIQDLALDADRLVAVGDGGAIVEVVDGTATLVHEDPGVFLYGVTIHGGHATVVGWSGTILEETSDGYVAADSPTEAVLHGVWVDDEGALAVGRTGSVLVRSEAP